MAEIEGAVYFHNFVFDPIAGSRIVLLSIPFQIFIFYLQITYFSVIIFLKS